MTEPRGINSKHKAKDFCRRGFRSMFSNYGREESVARPADREPPRKTGE